MMNSKSSKRSYLPLPFKRSTYASQHKSFMHIIHIMHIAQCQNWNINKLNSVLKIVIEVGIRLRYLVYTLYIKYRVRSSTIYFSSFNFCICFLVKLETMLLEMLINSEILIN